MLNPTFTVKFAFSTKASQVFNTLRNIVSKHKGKVLLGTGGGLGLAATVGPLNPTGYYDYIKPLFNRSAYKERILNDDNVQNYLSSIASKALLTDFNGLHYSDKLKYLKEKFMTSFGVDLPRSSFVHRYENNLKSKLGDPSQLAQLQSTASSSFYKRLKQVRDARRQMDSSVSRDPFDPENIAIAFQGTDTKPDGILNKLLYTGMKPFVKKEINKHLNS